MKKSKNASILVHNKSYTERVTLLDYSNSIRRSRLLGDTLFRITSLDKHIDEILYKLHN